MIRAILILEKIISKLEVMQNNEYVSNGEVISFLDKGYPSELKRIFFKVPLIYYKGNISLLKNLACVVHSGSPSYYVQSVIYQLRKDYNLLGLVFSCNSKTLTLYKYDIIYCNAITQSDKENVKLAFHIGIELDEASLLQLLSTLVKGCYILEGKPKAAIFTFISNCCDNETNVYALPTNIFSSTGILPNLLLDNGVMPLLLER